MPDTTGRTEVLGDIVLRDVTVRYGRVVALDRMSGQFHSGSMTAVVGSNGAGKSTLLGAIAGSVRLARGRVERAAAGRLAFLPQVATIDRDFPMTVAELIVLGGWREFGVFRTPPPSVFERVAKAVAAAGLSGRLDRRLNALSSGELQRALFARLILQDGDVILLDEPFAAVDARTTAELLHLVRCWHDEGRTVIAVLHDLDLVRAWFPSTLVLARRCVCWGPTEIALPEMVS